MKEIMVYFYKNGLFGHIVIFFHIFTSEKIKIQYKMLLYRFELSKFSISQISINMGKKINEVAFNKVTKIK